LVIVVVGLLLLLLLLLIDEDSKGQGFSFNVSLSQICTLSQITSCCINVMSSWASVINMACEPSSNCACWAAVKLSTQTGQTCRQF
jgi:hypothetical protein